MKVACEGENCWCCGTGHTCEPPRYPDDLSETWTCEECGRQYQAFDVHTDPRTSALVKKHTPVGTLGWRSAPRT